MTTLTRWNPYRDMMRMQETMDRFFDEAWRSSNWENQNGDHYLPLDVNETDEHYTVTADLPGIKLDNINVTVHDNVLTINAEIPEQTVSEENSRTLLRERRYGRMSRSIRLPQPIDSQNVEANFSEGTLYLTLPKSEEVRPKTISIKANGSKS